jgi:hypothetical protein
MAAHEYFHERNRAEESDRVGYGADIRPMDARKDT